MPTTLLVRIYTANPLEIGEIIKSPAMVIGMIFNRSSALKIRDAASKEKVAVSQNSLKPIGG